MSSLQAKAGGAQPAAATVDAVEVTKFGALADSWWDEDGVFRPLHLLNPARLRFIREQLIGHFGRAENVATPFDGLSLCDLGCGGGLVAEPMARLGFAVTAIDASAECIGVASAHAAAQGLGISYRQSNVEALVSEGALFNVVLALEIVEHVADLDSFIEAAGALVRPGGMLVLSTINRTAKSLALAKIGAEYILRWTPPGTHSWRKFLRPSELAARLRPAGLAILAAAGMSYRPVRREWVLSADLKVNYMIAAAKPARRSAA